MIAECNAPAADGIKKIIKSKGIAQSDIARQVGLTTQQFSDMLNGRKLIYISHLVQISKILCVSVDHLLGIKTIPCTEVIVTANDGELIASITGENAIEKDGCSVACVPIY